MNDGDVEARLARWRPAQPPPELMQRLHSAVPSAPKEGRRQWLMGEWLGGLFWRPWPVAYAGLLAIWVLILALRLMTPPEPAADADTIIARTATAPAEAPAFASTIAAERMSLLVGNNPDQLAP